MNYLSLEKGFRGLCFFIMLFLLLISGLSTEAAVVQSQGKRKLSGNVTTTEFGAPEPLPGVFISTKDMKSGGITDGNGHYEIEILDDVNVLTFSMVGYKTLELPIKGRQILDVVMQSETIQMNDVVVTALGIKKEAKKLGYAVQTVESKSLSEMPNPSIATTLSGKVAGMTVYNTPNMLQKNSISLRGVADPVIVIDGVPTNTNLYDINPMDIESISVLKGATAAALYGSKGQAGAIQITTKTGKSKTGQPAVSVEFSQRSMFRAGWIVFPETNNQYGNGLNGQYAYFDGKGNGLYDNDWVWGPKLDVEDPSTESGYWETTQWDSPRDADGNLIPTPFVSRGKDNLKNFLETGYTLSNNVSVTSSTEKTTFRVNLGYDYQNGEVPSTALHTYNASVSVNTQLNDRLKFSGNVMYNKMNSPNYPRIGYGNINILYCMLIWMGPDVDVRDFRNYWVPGREGYEQRFFNLSWINNPYFAAYEQKQIMNRDKTFLTGTLDYTIMNGLNVSFRQSADIVSQTQEMTWPYSFIGESAEKGNYQLTDTHSGNYNSELFIRYEKKINDFSLNAMVGGSINFSKDQWHDSKTQGLKVPNVYNLSNSLGNVISRNELTNYLRNSAYATLDLDYKSTYFLSLTAREDASSALPQDNNSYFYPSVSGSVILSNLFNMSDASFLKIRGSWAQVRADLSPYEYMTAYSPSITYGNNNAVAYPAVLGNQDLRPSDTKGFELGLTGKFFAGRLGFDATYYRNIDSEQIFNQSASLASGFTSYKINGNEFIRQGVELTVDAIPVQTSNLVWNTSVNWSLHRRTLKSVYGGADHLGDVKVGERMDKYMVDNAMLYAPDGQLIIGENGLPVRDDYRKFVGYLSPDWTMSWSNTIHFLKDFSLSFLFDARIGGVQHATMSEKFWYAGVHKDAVGPDRDAYVESKGGKVYKADGVNVISGSLIRDAEGNVISDTRQFAPNQYMTDYKSFTEQYYVRLNGETMAYDASFLKMRELSLMYNVPSEFLNKLHCGIKNVSLSVIANNLFILTKVPLADPDEGTDANLQFPSARNVGFNINVKF